MIEHFYDDPVTRDRHRTGPAGRYQDDFAGWLAARGYRRATARRHIRYVGYLSRWLADHDRALDELDEATIAAFVESLPASPYVRANKAGFADLVGGVQIFRRWLQDQGVLAVPAKPPVAPLIEAFEAWMVRHRQVSTVTLEGSYRPALLRFIAAAGDQPEQYAAAAVREFILAEASRVSRKRGQGIVSALRMFLRHLVSEGRCAVELVAAVPGVAHWKKQGLPKYISAAEVERILSTCDGVTAQGRRDRAMLLMLARLGLRAGDVTGLCLPDLDWPRGHLWVCGKARRREALPLPQDVGDATLAYLADGRPVADHGAVFLSLRAPHRPLDAGALGGIVARRAVQAGVVLPRAGSHVLRHSLATTLPGQGLSLAGIGSVLRHRDIDTTSIYAKVDVALLGSVARPWPLEVSR